MSSYKTKIGR